MYNKNKCLPYLILEDGQYIFIGDFKDPVRHDEYREISDNSYQIILSIESILDKNYFVNSKGIIEYRKPFCSKCNSHKVIRKDFNWKILYLEKGVPVRVKVRRYLCRKCGKKSQTEFLKFYNKYSNLPNFFKDKINKEIGKRQHRFGAAAFIIEKSTIKLKENHPFSTTLLK